MTQLLDIIHKLLCICPINAMDQFAIKTATQQYLTNKILTTFFNKNCYQKLTSCLYDTQLHKRYDPVTNVPYVDSQNSRL